jgi:hypothetical protein
MVLNLDTILAEPFEVTINGTMYKIEDPGMDGITRMIQLSMKTEKDNSSFTEFMGHIRKITAVIPENVFMTLSSKQAITLVKKMGEHFLSQADPEGKQRGPLPQGG